MSNLRDHIEGLRDSWQMQAEQLEGTQAELVKAHLEGSVSAAEAILRVLDQYATTEVTR